jgi:ATP-dependent DNA ligase
MKKVTLFHDASRGGQKQWSIWIENDHTAVTVEWGLVGGTLQRSSDATKPKGKPGTKSYKDEVMCARENYERQIRKKREEGYRAADDAPDVRDYMMALDKNFVPAKPINDMTEEELLALDRAGRLIKQRKRDGRRHLVLKTRTGVIRIYSRRMEELTDHMPRVRDALYKLPLPNGTILDGEIIVDRDGRDDFRATGTFTNPKTKPKKAAKASAALPVKFMLFDVLFYSGCTHWNQDYLHRWETVNTIAGWDTTGLIVVPQELPFSLTECQQMVRDLGWEGLVCWIYDQHTIVREGGSPKRTNCAKWKPVQEHDFIATGYYLGSGEISNVVGGLSLEDIDPHTGERRNCGNCGTGFDAETRADALTWKYPCVVQIEYDKQESTAKLRFPVFIRKRDDKAVDECIGFELPEDK